MNQEKESVIVVSKDNDVESIEAVIKEAEKELGVSSEITAEESEEMFDPALTAIAIAVGQAFVKAVVDKYGDSFKNWLSRKLGLDEKKGEKVVEAESEEAESE